MYQSNFNIQDYLQIMMAAKQAKEMDKRSKLLDMQNQQQQQVTNQMQDQRVSQLIPEAIKHDQEGHSEMLNEIEINHPEAMQLYKTQQVQGQLEQQKAQQDFATKGIEAQGKSLDNMKKQFEQIKEKTKTQSKILLEGINRLQTNPGNPNTWSMVKSTWENFAKQGLIELTGPLPDQPMSPQEIDETRQQVESHLSMVTDPEFGPNFIQAANDKGVFDMIKAMNDQGVIKHAMELSTESSKKGQINVNNNINTNPQGNVTAPLSGRAASQVGLGIVNADTMLEKGKEVLDLIEQGKATGTGFLGGLGRKTLGIITSISPKSISQKDREWYDNAINFRAALDELVDGVKNVVNPEELGHIEDSYKKIFDSNNPIVIENLTKRFVGNITKLRNRYATTLGQGIDLEKPITGEKPPTFDNKEKIQIKLAKAKEWLDSGQITKEQYLEAIRKIKLNQSKPIGTQTDNQTDYPDDGYNQ